MLLFKSFLKSSESELPTSSSEVVSSVKRFPADGRLCLFPGVQIPFWFVRATLLLPDRHDADEPRQGVSKDLSRSKG